MTPGPAYVSLFVFLSWHSFALGGVDAVPDGVSIFMHGRCTSARFAERSRPCRVCACILCVFPWCSCCGARGPCATQADVWSGAHPSRCVVQVGRMGPRFAYKCLGGCRSVGPRSSPLAASTVPPGRFIDWPEVRLSVFGRLPVQGAMCSHTSPSYCSQPKPCRAVSVPTDSQSLSWARSHFGGNYGAGFPVLRSCPPRAMLRSAPDDIAASQASGSRKTS